MQVVFFFLLSSSFFKAICYRVVKIILTHLTSLRRRRDKQRTYINQPFAITDICITIVRAFEVHRKKKRDFIPAYRLIKKKKNVYTKWVFSNTEYFQCKHFQKRWQSRGSFITAVLNKINAEIQYLKNDTTDLSACLNRRETSRYSIRNFLLTSHLADSTSTPTLSCLFDSSRVLGRTRT